MVTAKQLLDSKGHEVRTIAPDASVLDASKLMTEHAVGALVVFADGKVTGILSERDCVRRVLNERLDPATTQVGSVMTERVCFARPEQTVEDCMALMTEQRCRHLPIMKGDELLGIISIGDLVKSIIAEQEYLIHQLEQYVTG